jgi:hypothetical protein
VRTGGAAAASRIGSASRTVAISRPAGGRPRCRARPIEEKWFDPRFTSGAPDWSSAGGAPFRPAIRSSSSWNQRGSVASSVTWEASDLEDAQVTWPGRAR